jgi:hypothetical protein
LSNNRPTSQVHTLKASIQAQLATAFKLTESAVFAPDLTVAEIVAASPGLVNSVDFMECCAKVANGFRQSHGVQVRLPATSLDTPISVIVESFVQQASSAVAVAQ